MPPGVGEDTGIGREGKDEHGEIAVVHTVV